jgi:small subunit ribosomal protein S2
MLSMVDLLKAGVHFGHNKRFWNPKMKQYIFGVNHNIHIFNLEKTAPMLEEAVNFIGKVASRNGKILFVGTKRSAQNPISEQASRCGMPYVNHRWLGGMLTNYKTIRQSIKRLRTLEKMSEDGTFERLTKKEALDNTRAIEKLDKTLGGIKDMAGLPDAIVIIDSKVEHIAILEARRLGIPVVAVVDTNSDPDGIDYVVPGNDDAVRAINTYLVAFSDAIINGKEVAKQHSQAAKEDKVEEKSEAKK